MPLPPLLKYVYNHGTDEVIRRGKRIYSTAGASLLDHDPLAGIARFRVKNDQYNNVYTVTINKYEQPEELSLRCGCPYNMSDICRHEVAALFQLNDLMQSGFFQAEALVYDQKHTVLRLRNVSDMLLRVFTSTDIMDAAREAAFRKEAKLTRDAGDTLEAEVPDADGTIRNVRIRQNDERYFDTSCTCGETKYPLCIHKATVFLQVLQTRGPDHFHAMRNWDEQKNRLLGLYGYSLNDDLKGKFSFTYDDHGKPSLRVLDTTIKRLQPAAAALTGKAQPVAPVVVQERDDRRLGILLEVPSVSFPHVSWALIAGEASEDEGTLTGPIQKLDTTHYVAATAFTEADRELLPAVRKLQTDEVQKYLRKALPFGDFLSDAPNTLVNETDPAVQAAVWEYLLPKYRRLLQRFSSHPFCYLGAESRAPKLSELTQVALSTAVAKPVVVLKKTAKGVEVTLRWQLEGVTVDASEVRRLNDGLIFYGERIYSLESVAAIEIARELHTSKTTISAAAWLAMLEEKVMHWTAAAEVQFDAALKETAPAATPALRLYLTERDHSLLLRPVFLYNGKEVAAGAGDDVLVPQDGKLLAIPRNRDAEARFGATLRALHTDIKPAEGEQMLYMPAAAVLANNWFFRFLDLMREQGVELVGIENLRSLRLNTHRPETRVKVSSGNDWFDAAVELHYGDQIATIADIKRALSAKQNYVRLPDGSLGLLPDEWMARYGLLVKMGEAKGGKLRLKRFHFGIIEQLLAEVDEEAVQRELQEKKDRLAAIIDTDFGGLQPPETLQTDLRPYQKSGFQWLAFLREAGWGGILADDMGLGKTVQALTYFLHLKTANPEAKFLVVCPTTLVYNWESEIGKFTPNLTHLIHHGTKRTISTKGFEPYDIIITTYGTMRSDIKILRELKFDCIVLDESQAIKNPQSQVAKAALLLQADHRMALSGTPIQNNTFDLYSQLNFLNPGMLGTREFFNNTFATPIDKFGEDDVKKQLRQLTNPFLLRRTKEQVAKDLPEKTEMLLHCEMGTEQRRIYNAYRMAYKDRIMGLIEEQGLEKSQFHILQGLTKLRQICDAPGLLPEEADSPHAAQSIKLDELTRELEENVGDHKTLVFSQFLGMLALIRKRLEALGIAYAYFDGSSTAAERKDAVQRFQEDPECRVFLISLKAGGVGLNLTAADYVYLVDPWWNPAVEQQAIDRTHRIGQTKAIFAYRLICRDSIEEKMLLLQDRKRALAADLVADDGAFLKRLTRDDIAFLLS